MVVTYVQDYDLWLPAGADVDQVAHTVTARTSHFSEWALAITDQNALRDSQELAERLKNSSGGKLAQLITGEQDTLECDPKHVLLPATVREPVALNPQLCEEVLDDGSYRLQYVNTSGMPRILQLPPGFAEKADPLTGYDESVARLMAARHPGRAVVPVGGSLTVEFPGSSVDATTEITGDTDWAGYFVSLFRLVTAAALLDKAEEGKQAKLADDIDTVFATTAVWNCADDAQSEFRESHDVNKAVLTAFGKCFTVVLGAVAHTLGAVVGTSAKDFLPSFLERRIKAFLAIPELLELARDEMTGILQAIGRLGFGLDTTVTIKPVRAPTAAEAQGLPQTLWDESGSPGCGQIPPGTAVPDLPQGACVSAVQADLDGNGNRDTLLLWRPPVQSVIDPIEQPAQVGAVAVLDDGTFHLLEEPPSAWPPEDLGDPSLFDATRVVRFGTDRREEVVVAFVVGANTTHYVVLSVGGDRRLHALSAGAGPFDFSRGGGAGYESDFGCVTSSGRPLLATTGSLTSWDPNGGSPIYGWDREFYELDDVQLHHVGHEGGLASQSRGPAAGSDCSAPEPSARGPEIGATGLAATTPDDSARGFLSAVLNDDRSGVSRYLGGQPDVEWARGAGVDAWQQARIATQSDRAAWQGAALRCAAPTTSSSRTVTTCLFGPAAGVQLYVGLVADGEGRWLVSNALGVAGG
jgi:hypothetical protein